MVRKWPRDAVYHHQDEEKAQNARSRRRTGPIDGQQCKLRFSLKVTTLTIRAL
jgi:hypothetical protein